MKEERVEKKIETFIGYTKRRETETEREREREREIFER